MKDKLERIFNQLGSIKDKKVIDILIMKMEGKSMSEIGRKYKISRQRVHQIIQMGITLKTKDLIITDKHDNHYTIIDGKIVLFVETGKEHTRTWGGKTWNHKLLQLVNTGLQVKKSRR